MTLREKLIVLRDKAGISQMSLAHQLDVSRQAVSRWESGDTTPSMDKLKALAKIYGRSLDWLCSDSDMADEKPIEVVSPLEENETKNTTVSAKDKRKRKNVKEKIDAGVSFFATSPQMAKKKIFLFQNEI